MEYFRDPKNQIYADLAYRLGRIIVQYEDLVTDTEKFSDTLYIAVLQNLLANCNEYVREMTKGERRNSIFRKSLTDPVWGIDSKCWIKNTFNEEPTLENFISRIRNSVSHPTKIDLSSEYPSTGFSTVLNNTGKIDKFRFVNSPDTRNNRLKEFKKEDAERTIYILDSANQKRIKPELPTDIHYIEIKDKPGKYKLISNGETFIRISIIELNVVQLACFVKNLSNYLAQPIQKDWDGFTIKELIAA
jgi:hypothetical protein